MDLKDLSRLIKMCRELGVSEVKFQGVELKLTDLPEAPPSRRRARKPVELPPFGEITEGTKIEEWGELTEDQKLFYSVGVEET